MLRAILDAIASISRNLFSGALLLGEVSWQAIVAAHSALKPTPQTPADNVADAGEAALAEDDAVASADERRAAREAQRVLSAEIAQAAAEGVALKKVQVVGAAKVAPFKHIKPPHLRGRVTYYPAPKRGEVEPMARLIQRWAYNSLAGGTAYEVAPTLSSVPVEIRAWLRDLDTTGRMGVAGSGCTELEKHITSDHPADWSGQLPALSPERARIHREYVMRHGGRYYNPEHGGISMMVPKPKLPAPTVEEAEDAFGPYVPRRR
jgi:hypothetical protein